MFTGKVKFNKFNLIYLFPVWIIILILFTSLFCVKKNYTIDYKEISDNIILNSKIPDIQIIFADGSVKTVNIEEYLIGVVAAEMPPSFEYEALKAQAVAARTYILSKQNTENDKHPNADVCTDSAHCKAYISDNDAYLKWGNEWSEEYREKIKKAVDDTIGEIVTYNDEPIIAVFHSTSTGKTENAEDVWQTDTPYLKSVDSPGEELSPRYKSEVIVSLAEFKEKISELNSNADLSSSENTWITNYEYTEGGSVKFINIGGCEFKGTDIRNKFGLRSAYFNIVINNKVTFYVTGNGHGVGMSQYGANYAAKQGEDYKKILKKYYTDTEINKIY